MYTRHASRNFPTSPVPAASSRGTTEIDPSARARKTKSSAAALRAWSRSRSTTEPTITLSSSRIAVSTGALMSTNSPSEPNVRPASPAGPSAASCPNGVCAGNRSRHITRSRTGDPMRNRPARLPGSATGS